MGRTVKGHFACSRLLTHSLPDIVRPCDSWGSSSSSNACSELVLAFIVRLFMWVPIAWLCSFGLCLCSIVLARAHFVLVCVRLCLDGSVHEFPGLSCIKYIVSTCTILKNLTFAAWIFNQDM